MTNTRTPKLSAATEPPASSQRIAQELERRRGERAQAQGVLGTLAAKRPAVLLTGTDAELASLDGEIAAAQRQADRSVAWIKKLEGDLAAAKEAEREAERQRAYDHATAKVAEAVAWQHERYPVLAQEIADNLTAIDAAEKLAAQANKELPKGADRIGSATKPDWRARKTEMVTVPVMGAPLDQLPRVRFAGQGSRPAQVQVGTREERRVLDPGFSPGALADHVNLPSFQEGIPDYWRKRS